VYVVRRLSRLRIRLADLNLPACGQRLTTRPRASARNLPL
jgi:hypothetical protein